MVKRKQNMKCQIALECNVENHAASNSLLKKLLFFLRISTKISVFYISSKFFWGFQVAYYTPLYNVKKYLKIIFEVQMKRGIANAHPKKRNNCKL